MRTNLQAARKKLGLSQDQMADKIPIHPRYYKSLESGERLGSIWIWDKLERLTGVHQMLLRENHRGKEEHLPKRQEYPQS